MTNQAAAVLLDRRAFFGAVGSLVAPLVASAQPPHKVYRVGWVSASPLTTFSDPTNRGVRAFRAELRERGYVEGQNIILELRSVDGKIERASEVMADLLRLPPAVIMITGTEMVREAKRLTATVPIVMFSRAAVEEGLVVSLARPGETSPG